MAIPSAPITSPLMVEPSAATETTVSPRMASAKYSDAPRPQGGAGREPHGGLGLALLRHRVAVIGCRGGRCLAWNIEENGGHRAAEGGPDRDGGQHQQRRERGHRER